MKKVSVIVPVYYNEKSLPSLFKDLDQIREELTPMGIQMEVICVDDGSGDDSYSVLRDLQAGRDYLKLIKLTRNFGSMAAIKAGLKYVTGDCFTLLSADQQDDPRLILELARKWIGGSRFAICERESREDPVGSKFLSYIFYKALRGLAIKDYPEGGFDLFILDKRYLPILQKSEKNINLPVLSYWIGIAPDIIKYQRKKRDHGTSRWTLFKKIKLFLDTFIGFSYAPIRFISMAGIITSILSILYGIFVITVTLIASNPVPGWTTIIAIITFLLGLIMLMLGIIGEYLWRILDECRARPEFIVEETAGIDEES